VTEEALEREARERGSVMWQDSARGGAGWYLWSVRLSGDAGVKTGLADSEEEGWTRVREYVQAEHREVRRRGPRGMFYLE
jgi:hypothetical protein